MDEYLFQHFTTHLEAVHAAHGHQTDFRRLASDMGIRVRQGEHNSLVWGDPPLITLGASDYGARRNFSAMHEIAHLLLKTCGAEAELLHHFGSFEDAAPHIEAWCNHAAGLLLLPAPVLDAAEQSHGLSAACVLALHLGGRVSLGAALRRLVYAEPERRVAGFVSTASRCVSDVAKLNLSIPFWRYDALPASIPKAGVRQRTFRVGQSEGTHLRVPGAAVGLGLLVAD
ncbi:ImmA/IrrE family metallo-endopeptidase [Deinococcus sp.]|uniref:ImmA/IrrE family metallo-endopeptidase n=1 Tax=Deinococcus sp. TaxID=47478 RepID=UPI0025E695B2|nr:ImmA/IrrE family metallo-endopeptidase [Deinococcus sp.]